MPKTASSRALLLLPMLCACGGGGGGGGGDLPASGAGLAIPDDLHVVPPQRDDLVFDPRGGKGSTPGDLPDDSDYYEDTADVSVYDVSLEPLELIDTILSYMEQTAVAELTNEDPYRALLDTSLAAEGVSRCPTFSDEGRSSSLFGPDNEMWSLGSRRIDDDDPQLVKVWIPDQAPGDGRDLVHRARTKVIEGPVGANPFGHFVLDFAGFDPGQGSASDPVLFGTLATRDPGVDGVGFRYYEEQGNISQVPAPGERASTLQVNVRMDPDLSEGEAKILHRERYDQGEGDSGIVSEEHLLAFDHAHLLRQTNGAHEVAFHRGDAMEMVWRYTLYHADGPLAGERVRLDSGFGFRTMTGAYGHLGYYGMWLPEGTEVEDGDTVLRDVYGESGEDVPYTVVLAPGKLIRYERKVTDVDVIEGDPFLWWEWNAKTQTTCTFVIEFDGAFWVKTHEVDWETGEYDPIDPPAVIDTERNGYLNMWSDGLGGPAAWIHDEPGLVAYYEQSFVDSDDDLFLRDPDVTLHGFVDCLRAGLTGPEVERGDVFLDPAPDVEAPHVYVFSRDDLTLYHDPTGTGDPLQRVGLASGEEPDGGPYSWGLLSGPMVVDPRGLEAGWAVWHRDVFYVYETGHNPWNRYRGLLDALGDPVDLEAPIRFPYVHTAENDRNGDATFAHKTYFMAYGGPGNLRGFPEAAIDLDGDGEDDRWYPVVNLADGVLLGPTGTE